MHMLLVCVVLEVQTRGVSLITKRSTICVTGSFPNWNLANDTDDQMIIHYTLTGGAESHLTNYIWQHYANTMASFIALSSISCLIIHTLPSKNILFFFITNVQVNIIHSKYFTKFDNERD